MALFMGLFQINQLPVLIFLILTNSVIFSINDALIPSELHECFGDEHYGKILGTVNASTGFATMGLQYLTTWFYETERRKQDSVDKWCHGKICVTPGLLMMFILNIIAMLLVVLYLYRRKQSVGIMQQQEELRDQNLNLPFS